VEILSFAGIRDEYKQVILELTEKSNGSSRARIGAVLSSTMCEQLASHLIFDRNSGVEKDLHFDPYYGEKHEFTKRKFVDRLKTRLTEAGKELQFMIRTEEPSDFGHYDLVIINGNQLKIQTKDGRTIAVEFKASLGIDLSQIERYLLNGDTLLIVRIITGQVIRLSPHKLSEFLEESVRDLTSKAKRLTQGHPFSVPGYECCKCPITECSHNKLPETQGRRLISMGQKEFEEDFETFTQNLFPTIDRTVEIVLKHLEIDCKKPSVSEIPSPAQQTEQLTCSQSSSQQELPQSLPHH
jgi:hypothetical protein